MFAKPNAKKLRGAISNNQRKKTPEKLGLKFRLQFFYHAKKLLIVACFLVPVVLSGVLYPFLNQPITNVKVTGNLLHISTKNVELVISSYLNKRFFDIDLKKIRTALVSQPWVYQANLQRKWPNTLIVDLIEQKPLAVWREKSLLSIYGYIFHPDNLFKTAKLPRLDGPLGAEQQVMQQYSVLQKRLTPLGLRINALRLTERNTWCFTTDQVKIQLGSSDLMSKLARFEVVYDKVLKPRWKQVKTVDLRYDSGVAVSWQINRHLNNDALHNTGDD